VPLDRFERLIGRPLASTESPGFPRSQPLAEEIDLSRNWSYLSAQSALKATEDKEEAAERSDDPKASSGCRFQSGHGTSAGVGVDDEARALIALRRDLLDGGARDAAPEARRLASSSRAR